MKTINTLAFILILSLQINAQAILDWEYKNTAAYNYYPTTNIIHTDHGTYVCSQSIDANETAYIFRLDESGILINQDSIQYFNYSILQNKRMVMDINGSIYLCGKTINSQQVGKIRLIKYDSLLNKTWDIIYMDTSQIDYNIKGLLYSDTDDKIYMIAEWYDGISRIAAIKLDATGNTLWETVDTIHNPLSLVAYSTDHAGNVILGGYGFVSGGGEDFIITKLDTSGNINWYISEDGSDHSDDAVQDLCIDNLNNIYTVGRFQDTLPNKISKYNSDGNKLWTNYLAYLYLPKIAVDAAGSSYIVGMDSISAHECVINKFNSTGNYMGTNFSDIPNHAAYTSDYFVSIQTDDSANVYLLHNADSLHNKKWFVAKFDSSLSLQWSFIYPDSIANPSTSSSLCLFDGGFTIAGAINNFGELRVLQYHETFTTGINKLIDSQTLTHWPNPASDRISFRLGETFERTLLFRLYDVHSRLMLEKYVKMENQNTFNIDLMSFQNGVYFFNLVSDNKSFNGKLIKQTNSNN